MWFEFMDKFRKCETPAAETVLVGSRHMPLLVVRNPRARRYLLRMRADGTARVTIPRGGSAAAAREFVDRNRPWLERQWQQMQARPRHPAALYLGSTVLFRGELVPIQSDQPERFRFGTEILPLSETLTDLRPAIEKHLRKLAARELPARLTELAGHHGFAVKRVTVRSQRTRWGSCSQRSGISLNWRLIQTPAHVRDYIMLHELAHLRQMNHSNRFWHEVERLCPNYEAAERWLKDHRGLLRDA
jgi:predicted metal-dependent hydrolase